MKGVMTKSPQLSKLEDLRKQAEIYLGVNKPSVAVLPDNLKHTLHLSSEKKRALFNLPYPLNSGDEGESPCVTHLGGDMRENMPVRDVVIPT